MDKETASTEGHLQAALKYLTVQDILWINLQCTKKVQHFSYAKLEEATFYQYGYGSSRDLAKQAGRFLTGFIKLHPFANGNEATAFVGFAAFLLMNGKRFSLSDEATIAWLEQVRTGGAKAEAEVGNVLVDDESASHALHSDVRDSVVQVLSAFPKTLKALGDGVEQQMAS